MTTTLNDDEMADLASWTAANRPDRIRPLYRVSTDHAGNVVTRNLRDGDDEPWGDPVGLGMPRPPRRSLWRIALFIVTAKYRRVWA